MGSGEFTVELGQLREHTSTVGGIAEETSNAAQGAQAALSGEAFGLIGQFLASAILQACGDAQEGIMKAAQTVADVTSALDETVQAYRQIDTSNAGVLGGILQEAR